ncbi:hypothetical protein [Streptomyces cellostaticus]|uniref:hypothetical protein n=1 Tax=Streptomyces cellostaticus TaxID=67285 RepID=UPI002025F8F1|nr:hypothetical protein [Streptomyces cellostaticus]
MRTKSRTRWGLLAAIPLMSLLLAACGGDNGGDDSVASAGGDKQKGEQQLTAAEKSKKYTACLSERGVAPPGGKAGEDAPEQIASPEEVEAALAACKEFAPTAQDMQDKPDAKQLAQMREYVKCLRANGYDAPDPDPETGGMPVDQDAMKDMDKLRAAAEKCKDVNPASQR